ncbi:MULTISPECIES: helix-turn-helix domain-containing protein [unclassified Streptomyces]|uniref:helix-turn-helix domain-containing protein n=1 Tax=unclassified Streptomyces TaxID=2593676 RepID=UPI0037F9B9DD
MGGRGGGTDGRDADTGAAARADVPGDDAVWARELLDLLRPGAYDAGRVVDWLGTAVDASVSLRDETGRVLAGTGCPAEEGVLADVVSGRLASAAWEGDGRHLRLIHVDLPPPAGGGVLAVARTAPFDRRAAGIVTRTAAALELLLRAEHTTATGLRLARATSDLRLAILQLLMVEDTISARRVAAGLWPGLLDTDTTCVYVVESSPADRDRLAEACLAATRDRALVVRCPAVDAHVIVVTPGEAEGAALRRLCDRDSGTYLGGSTRQSLAHTAAAYGQAVSALAVARFRPDRAAVHAERTHPERLMDPAALASWAGALLRPLDTLPHHTRGELLATTRLGLEFTAVSAAKILGVSRNTVRARMERVEHLIGADFSDLTVRATVHLALHSQAAGAARRPGPAPAVLGGLLAGTALRAWAHDLLARLDTDGRDLRRTLRAWLTAGGNAERAAQLLGVHPQTVRDHIRGAEPVLERQLLATGSDLYEVVLAHLATGDLDGPVAGGTESGHPDAPVHR